MTVLDFYKTTTETLENLAQKNRLTKVELNNYYELTDFKIPELKLSSYKGLSQVFVQMAFHAQNASLISQIVKFKTNQNFLDKTLCHFNPQFFLDTYNSKNRKNSVNKIVNALRFNEKTQEGLKWNSSKSKQENKDTIIRRYANTLLDCAEYLCKFKNRAMVLRDLKGNYSNNDFEQLIKYFKKQIPHGFSIALTCDFLKEFDNAFCDLPKPDVHIKDTLCILKNRKDDYYSSTKKEYECIAEIQQLTKEINQNLPASKKITVYKLDRMIWLICSENFYLHNLQNSKKKYLDSLKPL